MKTHLAAAAVHVHSAEVKQHEEAECNETTQDDSIPAPLGSDSRYQSIDARNLRCRRRDSPVDTGQCLSLNAKVLVDSVCLRQHAVDHAMTLIQAASFLEHIFCFRLSGVRASKSIDVRADVSKQVLPITRFGYRGFETP